MISDENCVDCSSQAKVVDMDSISKKASKQLLWRRVLVILFKDILLTIADVFTDFYNVYSLYVDGYYKRACISLGIIWVPGLLMIVWIFFRRIMGVIDTKFSLALSILSGPFFPFWVTFSYMKSLWYNKNEEKFREEYIYAIFFKALEGIAEAAPQLLFNAYIMLVEGRFESAAVISMVFSFLSITKTATENHFIELDKYIPHTMQVIKGSWFFAMHILYRVTAFAILASYYREMVLVFIVMTIILNVTVSRRLLCTHLICTFWVSVASIFSATAFKHIERGALKGPGNLDLPECLLFYLFNAIIPFILCTAGLFILPSTLMTEGGGFISPEDWPITSCYQNSTLEKYLELPLDRMCEPGISEHYVLQYLITPIVTSIGVICIIVCLIMWLISKKYSEIIRVRVDGVIEEHEISNKPRFLTNKEVCKKEWVKVSTPDLREA